MAGGSVQVDRRQQIARISLYLFIRIIIFCRVNFQFLIFFFGFNFCVAWSVSLGAMSMRLNVYRVIPCRWNCQCVYSIHTVVYWNSFRLFKTVCASNTPHAVDVWHSTPYWNLSLGYIRLFRFGLRHTPTTDTQTHTHKRAQTSNTVRITEHLLHQTIADSVGRPCAGQALSLLWRECVRAACICSKTMIKFKAFCW